VLAIPSKRFTRTMVQFLTRPEVDAMLAAPDQFTWSGRRDHAFLLVAVQTGLRLSEMTGHKRADLIVRAGAHLRVIGKGRKERCTALAQSTLAVLKAWLRERNLVRATCSFPALRVNVGHIRASGQSNDGVQEIDCSSQKEGAVASKTETAKGRSSGIKSPYSGRTET
jgi:integrase